MEIDITDFVTHGETWGFSGSVMTHGANAGPDTWAASKEQAKREPMLTTEEQLQAMRDFALSSGGWDEEGVAKWDADELNALLIQWIAGDMRENGMDECDIADFDWAAHQREVEFGEVCGRIYRVDVEGHPLFGRIFFDLSN